MSDAVVGLDEDHHVHSTFSDDAVSTPAENLAAADRAGLRVVRMVDHVRESTTYVPEFLATVRALPRIDGLTVLTGVEAKILDADGHGRRARARCSPRSASPAAPTASCSPTTRSPGRTARGARARPCSGSSTDSTRRT